MSIFMALLGLIVLRAALLYAADLVLARIVSLATIRSLTVSVLRSLLSGARRARRLGFVTATEAARNASQKESDVMPLRQPSAILR